MQGNIDQRDICDGWLFHKIAISELDADLVLDVIGIGIGGGIGFVFGGCNGGWGEFDKSIILPFGSFFFPIRFLYKYTMYTMLNIFVVCLYFTQY